MIIINVLLLINRYLYYYYKYNIIKTNIVYNYYEKSQNTVFTSTNKEENIDSSIPTDNKLTQEEKDYFTKKLNNKYTYIGQAGNTGASTSAYLMKDTTGEKYILKVPSNKEEAQIWVSKQKETWKLIKDIFSDYNGTANIPKYLTISDDYVIEKYLGEDLTAEMYNQLSDTEKDGIAKDMASFLVYLHNKHSKGPVCNLELMDEPPLMDIFNYAKSGLTEQEQKELADKIEQFNNRDKSDEFIVLTHQDIRDQNVLYDRETKKVAIIDLELMSNDNIYRDFVPYAAASFGLPYDLLFNIVDYYNKSSDIKVSKDKVKLLHELGIWHEYVRCSMSSEKELSKDIYDDIKSKLGDLEEAYERNLKK